MNDVSRVSISSVEMGKHAGKHAAKISTAEKTVSQVALDYLGEASGTKNMVLKPIALGAELVTLINPNNMGAAGLMRVAKDAKNLSEITYFGKKSVESWNKGSQFLSDGSLWSFGILVNRVTDLYVSVYDAAKTILAQVMPLSKRVASVLDFSSNVATVTGMCAGLVEENSKINEARAGAVKDKTKKAVSEAMVTNGHLNEARNVCYLALGLLGGSTFALGVAVSPAVMWFFSVGALASTLGGHFHKKLVVEKLAP